MTDERSGGRAHVRAALWIGAAAFVLLLRPWIPIPGLDTEAWSELARWAEITRPTISPLGISLGALVLVRLVLAMIGSERAVARVIAFVVYLVITLIQALAIAFWLESLAVQLPFGADLVPEPGLRFRALAVLTAMAGAAALWWVADRIDATRAATGALAFALLAALYDGFTSAATIVLTPSPEDLPAAGALLVVPVCALLVTIALAWRPAATWPLKIVGALELRSGFDVLAAPAAIAALVTLSIGALSAPAMARALFVLAGSVALAVALWRADRSPADQAGPRRVLWPAGVALAALAGVLAPLSFGVVSSGALSRAFAPGPLEGTARFELTLAAVDSFEDGEAEAMVARLQAGGAVASLRSADEARITLRVENAFDQESVLEALRPHTLALHLVTDFTAAPLPAGVKSLGDHAYGACEVIRGLAPTLACHAAVEPYLASANQAPECRVHCLEPEPTLTGRDVRDAVVAVAQTGSVVVNATLRESAAAHFEEVTRANVGRQLAIVVDGEIASAPVINAPIPGGEIQIDLGTAHSHQESRAEADALVQALTAGRGITSEWTLESLTSLE